MRGVIVRTAIGGVLATVLFVLGLLVTGTPSGRLVHAYVLVLGALSLVIFVRAARPPAAAQAKSAFESALRRRHRRVERVEALERIERQVSLSLGSQLFLHTRLRPLVARIASERLLDRRGIDLERDPERARAALEPVVWDLVRPDREAPRDDSREPVPAGVVEAVVEGLERI